MNTKINQYVEQLFKPYQDTKSVIELKHDLLSDLNERYQELKIQGKEEDTAVNETIASIGDIEEILKEMSTISPSPDNNIQLSFNASDLKDSDFSKVTLHNGKLMASDLKNANFSGSDLSGSSFKSSDLEGANFNDANISNCNFLTLNLKNASFSRTIINNTKFNMASLEGVIFKDLKLMNVDFSTTDLRNVTFDGCVIDGCIFNCVDLSNQNFDGQSIRNVHFGKVALTNVSFKKATLQNVSFKPPIAITNKYYKVIKTIQFGGAFMDKLTYNSLKSLGANVTNVTILNK